MGKTMFVWGDTPDLALAKRQWDESDLEAYIASNGKAGVAATPSDWREVVDPATVEHEGRLYTPHAGASELHSAIRLKKNNALEIARTARNAGILSDVIALCREALARW